MTMMEEALASASDTKACAVGPGAQDGAAAMFRELFPAGAKAIVIEQKKNTPDYSSVFDGGRRIRTFEGRANGFTVRPGWPLRYSPMYDPDGLRTHDLQRDRLAF